MKTRLLVAALLAVSATGLHAQGRGHGRGHARGHARGHDGDGHGRRVEVVTVDRAVVATRDVIVERGWTVVRVERRGPERVVYYYRGRHRHGPLERVVVRPEGERVVFVDSDPGVTVDIGVRLRL